MGQRARARALVVTAAVMVVLVSAGCGADPAEQVGTGSGTGWTALPAAPLSTRAGAVALWDGTEVLVFGGFDEQAARDATRGPAPG